MLREKQEEVWFRKGLFMKKIKAAQRVEIERWQTEAKIKSGTRAAARRALARLSSENDSEDGGGGKVSPRCFSPAPFIFSVVK